MEEVERRYILRVLEAVGGNKTPAAQVLGLDRKTLYRKLERYGVLPLLLRLRPAVLERDGAVEDQRSRLGVDLDPTQK